MNIGSSHAEFDYFMAGFAPGLDALRVAFFQSGWSYVFLLALAVSLGLVAWSYIKGGAE